MQGLTLLAFTYLAGAVILIGLVYRALKIAKMPVHLRWELSPVPHEKGKSAYGGSYFEEYEWWTKPREKSLINEAWYMFKEIVFLKGVYEKNRRLWCLSFPFHFGGIYLGVAAMAFMFLGAVLELLGIQIAAVTALATVLAIACYALGLVGVTGLLVKRLAGPDMRPFTTFATLFNLLFLLAVYASGAFAVSTVGWYGETMTGYFKALLTFDVSAALPAPLLVHVVLVLLFFIYLPFTYMMHFVAKYFTYHEVRWNDEPMKTGTRMEKEVQALLGQKVSWAAGHIQGQGKKTWVDVATEEVKK